MADTARIEELRRRVQMDPASIAFAALAEEYRRARRFDDAITTCRTGLQRHPAYLSARVTLGRSLLEIDRYDEARQELEHVLRVAPENLAAIRALAEIHHRAGELPEAADHYQAVETATVPDAPQEPARTSRAVVRSRAEAPVASAAGRGSAGPAAALAPQATATSVDTAVSIPPRSAAPVLPAVAPPPRQPHPDEVALPALEVFLSAIVAARTSGNRVSS